ncbi:hypothetical protein O7635_33775 [Asanoa sp. WMMD1127]|nr:hypothetical protein [Asanoa sp. WMMD1127]MDG4826844.1 hypothetical protein [Asanoa sp. WMMD1127]
MTGPALAWRDGWEIHAWRGTAVEPRIHGRGAQVGWLSERAETREVLAQRLGYGWLLHQADVGEARSRIAADEHGELRRVAEPLGEDFVLLKEPDGSVRRVPPDQTVPRAAVAWSHGLGGGTESRHP